MKIYRFINTREIWFRLKVPRDEEETRKDMDGNEKQHDDKNFNGRYSFTALDGAKWKNRIYTVNSKELESFIGWIEWSAA